MVTWVEGLPLTKSSVPLIMWSCYITSQNRHVISPLSQCLYKYHIWYLGDIGWWTSTYQVTCPLDYTLTGCCVTKKETFLHFHMPYKLQIWRSSDLRWGAPIHKVISSLLTWSHAVMWQIRNVLSPLPQDLLLTNLAK